MTETLSLLDTPKKSSLQSRSVRLRTALKEFERAFAERHDGRKPSKDDIKADERIALQYKEYAKLRDVIAGKVSYEAFVVPGKSPVKNTSRKLANERISSTPQKTSRPNVYDPYDAPNSASPQPWLLSAVGPTPQRDGKILGLFDLVPSSATNSQTQSSSARKRKLDTMLDQSPRKINPALQTPSQRRNKVVPDLFEHLTGSPDNSPQARRRNLSRTPVSEGRKFMLSQFFATPSSVKHAPLDSAGAHMAQTPLRDRVLGQSVVTHVDGEPALDATPAYLKRSTSFKDRLMSASTQPEGDQRGKKMPTPLIGPPTLIHFKSGPKPLSRIVSDLRDLEDGDHDDELDALRELEDAEINLERKGPNAVGVGEMLLQDNKESTNRVWKKRGQKRTTRRAKICPSVLKISEAPKFVSAEDEDEGEEDEYDELYIADDQESMGTRIKSNSDSTSHDRRHDGLGDNDEFGTAGMKRPKQMRKSWDEGDAEASKTRETAKHASNKKNNTDVRTINPNAQSHMNYRTLKIRNKNSKAKKGGRFGRR